MNLYVTCHPERVLRTLILRLMTAGILLGACAMVHADDGDPDTTFAGSGKAVYRWPTSYEGHTVEKATTRAVAALADGRIVIAGTFDPSSLAQMCAIRRFKSNGDNDYDFGEGTAALGTAFVEFGDPLARNEALGVFAGAANTILVVGVAETMNSPGHRPAMARLLANGQLDPSFGVGGRQIIQNQPFGPSARTLFNSVAMAPDGKILMAGYCDDCSGGSGDDFVAVRLNPNGTVDGTYGTSGWFRFGRNDGQSRALPEVATAVAVDTQGRVILGGYSEAYNDNSHQQKPLLVRTTPIGQLDTAFNVTGVLDVNLLGSLATSALAIDAYNDGIILAANITNSASVVPGAVLTRIKRTGVVDTTFGQGGLVFLQYDEGTNVTALVVRRDRRIVAAGWIDPVGNDTSDFFAARMLFNGALDNSFDGNGVNRYTMPFEVNSIDIPFAMTLSGERPVIAGSLFDPTAPGFGKYASAVVRLQSDAIFENDFD